MAINKNALIRYKTIDKCLQNHYRKWTLIDLVEACSEALCEYEGRTIDVSKRTIQLDIQMLRSDKLGYNAPIIAYEKKYYKYEDSSFSITNIPLNEDDIYILQESVEVLKQFREFSLFSDLGGIINKLEDKIYAENSDRKSIIHLDKNENLKGLEHLDLLYQSILKEICLTIEYKSFKARNSGKMEIHPYLLKEYNNRWFLIGKREGAIDYITLALDRMESISYNLQLDYKNEDFDGDQYYQNTIGVTVLNDESIDSVVLKLNRQYAQYILTKPIHHSQRVLEKLKNGDYLIGLSVHRNFEFERVLLGFGNQIEVMEPNSLRRRIRQLLKKSLETYL